MTHLPPTMTHTAPHHDSWTLAWPQSYCLPHHDPWTLAWPPSCCPPPTMTRGHWHGLPPTAPPPPTMMHTAPSPLLMDTGMTHSLLLPPALLPPPPPSPQASTARGPPKYSPAEREQMFWDMFLIWDSNMRPSSPEVCFNTYRRHHPLLPCVLDTACYCHAS